MHAKSSRKLHVVQETDEFLGETGRRRIVNTQLGLQNADHLLRGKPHGGAFIVALPLIVFGTHKQEGASKAAGYEGIVREVIIGVD